MTIGALETRRLNQPFEDWLQLRRSVERSVQLSMRGLLRHLWIMPLIVNAHLFGYVCSYMPIAGASPFKCWGWRRRY